MVLQGDSMTKGLNRLVRVISKNNEGGSERLGREYWEKEDKALDGEGGRRRRWIE